jgi:hypothetical protein
MTQIGERGAESRFYRKTVLVLAVKVHRLKCAPMGNIPLIDFVWGVYRKFPVELVRGHRLRMAKSRGHCEPAPGFAAEAGLSEHTPNAAPTDHQPVRRQQILEPARAVGATPLGKIVLHFGLHLLARLLPGREADGVTIRRNHCVRPPGADTCDSP